MDKVLLARISTNQRISIRGGTIESTGCCYYTPCVRKERRKLLYLLKSGVGIVIYAIIMAKWWINTILVSIAKLCLRFRLVCPTKKQEVVFWSRPCTSMASDTVHSHRKLVPCRFFHDGLRRLEKIDVALQWRDGKGHTTNSGTEASSPGIGRIHEPVSLNRSLVCYKLLDAVSMEKSALYLSLLLHLHT